MGNSKCLVIDSHCDTPLRLYEGADISKRDEQGHFDFIRMKEGGVDVVFFAIYTSNFIEPDAATRKAMQLIARTYDAVEKSPDKVAVALSAEDALELKEMGLGAIFMGMENGLPIQKDLSLLRLFYDMGIRYMTLTHGGNNEICDSSSATEKRWSGLSPFGKKVIKEMNRLGMIIDVSHISDDSFYDVLKYSKKPVVATHSCCRALADLPRNMSDEMIKALAASNSVIQINFYPPFLDREFFLQFRPLSQEFDEIQQLWRKHPVKYETAFREIKQKINGLKRPSCKVVVDHIEHAVKTGGIDCVGIGSDFDGIEITPEGLEGVEKIPVIKKELSKRGYSKGDIDKIMGGNFLRVMKDVF
ncbi:MAG: dipeptidase [Bacteroidales bacterium]|nr:dipeptidase [Bacteroidales bacterium]MDD2425447.1 dipeptidase [Bacteroidales bacterium]MDD3988567.1 dipeptidase [Bacteroidales bacterium]MDD4638509.1 dipeptidase [Bacteroidales bacterium]